MGVFSEPPPAQWFYVVKLDGEARQNERIEMKVPRVTLSTDCMCSFGMVLISVLQIEMHFEIDCPHIINLTPTTKE